MPKFRTYKAEIHKNGKVIPISIGAFTKKLAIVQFATLQNCDFDQLKKVGVVKDELFFQAKNNRIKKVIADTERAFGLFKGKESRAAREAAAMYGNLLDRMDAKFQQNFFAHRTYLKAQLE